MGNGAPRNEYFSLGVDGVNPPNSPRLNHEFEWAFLTASLRYVVICEVLVDQMQVDGNDKFASDPNLMQGFSFG